MCDVRHSSVDASSTEKYFKEAVDGFRQKRDFVLAELESIDGIPKCATPEGAFYIFPVVEKYFGAGWNARIACP